MEQDETFYVAQKAFIRKGDEVLVLSDPIEGLDYPGGKVQIGEIDLKDSLKREVLEETNIKIEVGRPFFVTSETFKRGEYANKRVFIIAYECDYISGDMKLSKEHDNFVWVDKNDYSKVNDGTSFFEMLEKYFSK